MANIEAADITDAVLKQFTLTAYLAEAEEELTDIGETLGVREATDFASTPHYKVKRCLIAFACMRIAQDNMGVNNADLPAIEKYTIKYNVYRKEYRKLKAEITSPMITGDVDEMRDRAGVGTGTLFRS